MIVIYVLDCAIRMWIWKW